MVIRIYRYARQHVELAEKILEELADIRRRLHVREERAENIYTQALTNGDICVPISFMKNDNEYNRYRKRMDEKQDLIVVNLTFSLSFCAELVSLMVHDPESDALGYKVRTREIIDRIINVATDEAMDRATLASLAPLIAKIESEIVLNDFDKLRLMKKHLMN